MQYYIRAAAEKDAESVQHFISLLEETSFDAAAFASIYLENICNKNFIYLVAVLPEEKVIGFISCHTQKLLHHCGIVAEIQELYVDETYRSLSIGKALVNTVEEKLKLINCLSFEVTAQNKREQTHQFYQRMGFANSHKKFVKQL
ncbi:MAG: GNAT family N-acetyltransferase [Chitinophagaceae bacterium]